jgi:enediyne biosynthesis protein E4
LQLRLRQDGVNRDAIGAWVEVEIGAGPMKRVLRQEHTIGGGHASGHLGWIHFGIADSEQVRVRVRWPHQAWSAWQNAAANQFYVFDKARGLTTWTAP